MMKAAQFNIKDELVRQAFALSKQTVVHEQDAKLVKQYHKLPFVEFLEFLGRAVDL